MRGLLQHWTKSSIIPTSKEESAWRNKKAQKQDRFLRGRQIAYLIYDYFRVIGSHDSVENYADLFTISLRNDDVQEFDSEWDGILLSMTKIPHDDILEGLYKLRVRESEKLKTVLELYDLETHQKKLGPDYHRLKTMVKRSIEQEIRNKNFWSRNGKFEKNAVVKNQGTKQSVRRILGDCWQWETNGQCVKGDNCSFRHDITKRGKVTPSNPSPNSFMQQNERKSSRTRSPRGRSPSGRTSRWPCKDYFRGTCNNSFCEKWHPPECLFYKTMSSCSFEESARMHIVRLMNNLVKGPKRMMTKVQWLYWRSMSCMIEWCNPLQTVTPVMSQITDLLGAGHRIHDNWVVYSRTWSRRSFIDFTEELRHAEANPTCEIHKGYCASHQISRPKSFDRLHLSRWTSWA